MTSNQFQVSELVFDLILDFLKVSEKSKTDFFLNKIQETIEEFFKFANNQILQPVKTFSTKILKGYIAKALINDESEQTVLKQN